MFGVLLQILLFSFFTIIDLLPVYANPGNDVSKLSDVIKLADRKECAADIRRLCDRSILNNDYAVIECLQNDKAQEDTDLTAECHHVVWNFKRNITLDNRFSSEAKRKCPKLLAENPQCQEFHMIRGHMLSCLIDHIDNATETDCHYFLNKMEIIIFSDYRLIYKFAEACDKDIQKLKCGRLESNSDAIHSQGETIECLSRETDKLSSDCQHEIYRIAELQAEDFHLDRPLFFACREDRERFCEKVTSGDGRVYRCLMRHKTERDMSKECRKKLFQREKMIVQDYKVSRGLTKVCREDIKAYHCRDKTSSRRPFRLEQILLCLENVQHKGYPVSPECKAEMIEHRKSLLEDYRLTPNLALVCEEDIVQFCGKNFEIGGKTLHCLMDHSRRSSQKGRKISDQCQREVEALLKAVDIGEDWRLDPILRENCKPVVDLLCKDIRHGDGNVLSCLMDHLDGAHMIDSCRTTLLQIQYFLARNFELDPGLYKGCRKEAIEVCNAKPDWWDKPEKMDPDRGPLVLHCLYQHAYHPDENFKLTRDCLYQVRRVMRQLAVSVNLHPEIEEPCLNDLSRFCSEHVEKGEEIMCLQRNFQNLNEECQKAVTSFTEEEAEHAELNYPLFHSCDNIIQSLCKDMLSKDVDQGDIMSCLINNKNDPLMKKNSKCRTAVEHFQLLSLQDYRFSFKFKEACKKDVLNYCKTVKTKYQVISCLSEHVMNDTFQDKKQRISKECRQHLRVELFEREENIKLNPVLNEECVQDQKKFCSNVSPGESQILECLKNNQRHLSSSCHKALFKLEKEEMVDNAIDFTLMTVCKTMIKKFCPDEHDSQVLYCLRDNRNTFGMDPRCRAVVMKRLLTQNTDYRLNVRLKEACSRDIPKFCSSVIAKEKQDEEFEGKVIACLKKQYRKTRLSATCEAEILSVMREVAQDYQLDPVLVQACSVEIRNNCEDREETVEDCLRSRFVDKKIFNPDCKKEVARLIQDGNADIQSDPTLYHVCITDIKHYCQDIPAGHGKQLSCLLTVLDSGTGTLSEECKTTLTKRLQMFEYAAEVAPAESVEELIRQVSTSPARNYFIVIALCVLGSIFFGGLFCGRVTKKIPASAKNK
ncbi:Golgi apparatus protein 1 [Tachypleus tridentatus]|uniref:Golgi apparatus protein 1 n=1 Tax=Tachypleus tridentatus TaxID=6853 RepID=UPI003FD57355